MSFINCTVITEKQIKCGNVTYAAEELLTYRDNLFWIYLGIYVALVLFAGLMSGLTMGLLSLDVMTLKIMKDGGSMKEKKQAEKILPIVKRHHLLLVTLLLANAAAVESMPIFLDKISSPVIAILVSVTAVLIFGEVVPQAVCTRFGLAIGAALAPVVYILMATFFIIAWPLSKLLDCLLGTEHGTFYRRAQLKVLVDLHASTPHSENGSDHKPEESLTVDEVLIIKIMHVRPYKMEILSTFDLLKEGGNEDRYVATLSTSIFQGALDMKHKTVRNAMLPLDDVFMLDINSCMDRQTMKAVVDMTHSRVPVYEGEKTNIISMLIVKRLILLDPDDATPVKTLLSSNAATTVIYVEDNMPLYDLLNLFQTGKGHLAVVKKSNDEVISQADGDEPCILVTQDSPNVIAYSDVPVGAVIGIITLEDVIEELIQEEIIDETDVYVDIHKRIQVARAQLAGKKTGDALRQLSNRSTGHNIQEDDASFIDLVKTKSPPGPRSRGASGTSLTMDQNIEETTDEKALLLQ